MKPILIKPLNDNQQACVELLQDALNEAKAGNIKAAAMVICLENGWATVFAGNPPGDLNLGLDDLKRKILDAVVGPKKSILKLS
jgi:hypothetical protein